MVVETRIGSVDSSGEMTNINEKQIFRRYFGLFYVFLFSILTKMKIYDFLKNFLIIILLKFGLRILKYFLILF